MESLERAGQSGNLSEKDQEARKIRRLQVMMGMVMSVISQDPSLTVEEASELAAGAKRAALAIDDVTSNSRIRTRRASPGRACAGPDRVAGRARVAKTDG